MTMKPFRKYVALAIDGGGIRGLIVARALMALEQAMGGGPLIEQEQLKILAGTSTGATITTAIAIGMPMAELADIYGAFGAEVFPPLLPYGTPKVLVDALRIFKGLARPALYQHEPLQAILRRGIGRVTGNPQLTMGELSQRLRPDQALIITAVDINDRRTHFLKSYSENDRDWELASAALASSSAPTIFPVFERQGTAYTDGGVGNYANPAYIAARESVEWCCMDPADVTLLSFGTGWVRANGFTKARGAPRYWRLIRWAQNAPDIMLGDAMRSQSLDIIYDYVRRGMDFRRFQLELDPEIGMTDTTPHAMERMKKLGDELGQRVLNNQFAGPDSSQYDPEGIYEAMKRYDASVRCHRTQLT